MEEQLSIFEDNELNELEINNVMKKVKRGEIWILGNHRLMCGDATNEEDVKKLMNNEKADMIFIDPPYGVSYSEKNKFLNIINKRNRIQKEIENDS